MGSDPLDDPVREIRKTSVEEDFDFWKLDRHEAEETHQAEFALK